MTTTARGHYTAADLAATPDDGQRYEVIDGSLIVTPMAGGRHQYRVGELFAQLRAECPVGLVVLPGLQIAAGANAPVPDIAVVREGNLPVAFAPTEVLLVVEVTSPRQERRDLVTKRDLYQRLAIPTYVVGDSAGFTVFEPTGGDYQVRGSGSQVHLTRPYAVMLTLPQAE